MGRNTEAAPAYPIAFAAALGPVVGSSLAGWTVLDVPHHGWATGPPNKELKLTKPSIMELRSLTPVFCGPLEMIVADDSPDQRGEAKPGYKPKAPLWQSKPEPPPSRATLIALGLLASVFLAVTAVLFEGSLLSMPIGQTTVTVMEVQAGRPADEVPASYRHLVELPDGTRRNFVCERIHRPGERLLVTVNRGLLTGRVRLGAPYVVVVPTRSSSDVDSHSR
jgi:hypothetical protein